VGCLCPNALSESGHDLAEQTHRISCSSAQA